MVSHALFLQRAHMRGRMRARVLGCHAARTGAAGAPLGSPESGQCQACAGCSACATNVCTPAGTQLAQRASDPTRHSAHSTPPEATGSAGTTFDTQLDAFFRHNQSHPNDSSQACPALSCCGTTLKDKVAFTQQAGYAQNSLTTMPKASQASISIHNFSLGGQPASNSPSVAAPPTPKQQASTINRDHSLQHACDSTAQHSKSLSFTRSRSLARLLGVDDMAARDMESPAEVDVLPLKDFSTLETCDVASLLAECSDNQECSNLLAVSPYMPAAMNRARWSLEDYDLLKHLHHGYVSDVVEARCKRSGARVALKVYSLPEMPSLHRVQLLREIRLHLALEHPHVVRLWAAFMEQGVLSAEVGRGRYNHVVLVQEYAEHGDLLALMMGAGGRLSERRAVNDMLRPLLGALAYCHGRGIVHRDLKPGNVLYGRDWALKLADFGLSLDLNEERANTRAGTLEFMAPEVLRCPSKNHPTDNKLVPGAPDYTTMADAWGVGALLYVTITGRPPFQGANNREVANKILAQDPAITLIFPDHVSQVARDFVTICMQPEAIERPTVYEMMSHPLLAMYGSDHRLPAPKAAAAPNCNAQACIR